jgi:hypothetical protein
MKHIIVIITIVLLSFSSCVNRTNNEKNEVIKEAPVVQKLEIIYDLPALKGKSIDEVVKILGIPEVSNTEPTKAQINSGINTWEKGYKRNGYELLITYDVLSRKIIDFFVPTNNSSGKTKNYNDLLQITNTENQSGIVIKPVPTLVDPSSYTGLKIKL